MLEGPQSTVYNSEPMHEVMVKVLLKHNRVQLHRYVFYSFTTVHISLT